MRESEKKMQRMSEYLEALIVSGQFPPGSCLPSLRELCVKFDISRSTAARGMCSLEERGIIEMRHGAGAYVSFRREPAKGKFKVAAFSEHADLLESYCANIIWGMRRKAAELDIDLQSRVCTYNKTRNGELFEETAKEVHAILLVGFYDLFLTGLPRICPVVGIDMYYSFGVASRINLDPVQCSELAADYFRANGITKVKAFNSPVPLYRHRVEVFADIWKRHGSLEIVMPISEYRDELMTRALYQRMLGEMNDPDCGYLFMSGTGCERVQRVHLENTGELLSSKRCMLAIDGKSLLIPDYLPVPTISPDYAEMGELAIAECLRRIEHPGAYLRRIEVSGILHELSASSRKGKK